MMRFTHVISILACLPTLCAGALADTIALKTSSRLPPNASIVCLADLAVLEGPEALRLANVEVAKIKADGSVTEIAVDEVRKALEAAGANWAKVNLSGRSVVVRPSRDANATAPQAMMPTEIKQSATHDPGVVDDGAQTMTLETIAGEQSIRGSIATLIVANLRIEPRAMRVRFERRDSDLLATPLSAGRFEVQPLGSLEGDRMEFAVRGWQGPRATHTGQVTLLAERKANITSARRDLPRDRALTEDDLETIETWLPQSEAMMAASRVSAVGRVPSRALKAGDVIRARDLQRETLINRGDLVTVRCLVGGVAISLQAEAKADGSDGDTIEFRKSGEREAFLATVTGRNEALVDLAKR